MYSLEALGTGCAIVDRWIVARKHLEQVGVIHLELDLHKLLQVFVVALQLFPLFHPPDYGIDFHSWVGGLPAIP